MSAPLAQIFSLTLIPVAATILGAVVATYRAPGEKLRSFVQHFAAGVVFAVVAGELLPEITRASAGRGRDRLLAGRGRSAGGAAVRGGPGTPGRGAGRG